VVSSNYAVEAVRRGLSTPERNAAIAEAWREWTADPSATFTITHTEIVARA